MECIIETTIMIIIVRCFLIIPTASAGVKEPKNIISKIIHITFSDTMSSTFVSLIANSIKQ